MLSSPDDIYPSPSHLSRERDDEGSHILFSHVGPSWDYFASERVLKTLEDILELESLAHAAERLQLCLRYSAKGTRIFAKKSHMFRFVLRNLKLAQHEYTPIVQIAKGSKLSPLVQTTAFLEVSDWCQDAIARRQDQHTSEKQRVRVVQSELLRIRVSSEDMRELLTQELEDLVAEMSEANDETDVSIMQLHQQLDAAQVNASATARARTSIGLATKTSASKKERPKSTPIGLGLLARGIMRGSMSPVRPLRPRTSSRSLQGEAFFLQSARSRGADSGNE